MGFLSRVVEFLVGNDDPDAQMHSAPGAGCVAVFGTGEGRGDPSPLTKEQEALLCATGGGPMAMFPVGLGEDEPDL